MAYSALYSDPLFKRMIRMVNTMHAEVSAIAASLAEYDRMHNRFAPRLLLGPSRTDYDYLSPTDSVLDDPNTMSMLSREFDSRWPMTSSMFAADFREEQGRYVVKVDVPGMTSANLKVTIENGRDLAISGERKSEYSDDDAEHGSAAPSPSPEDSADDEDVAADKGGAANKGKCMYERYFGSFSRTMRLPADIDISKVDASVANGILTIAIGKLPKAKDDTQAHNVQVR